MDNKKVKVAIYVRVSSEEQAEKGFSIDEQQKLLLSYCEREGYEVHDIYVDAGISGKDIEHRPSMKRLLADAKEKKFNLVITWKISRLSRKLKDSIEIVDYLDKYNIQYKSYSEPFESGTSIGKLQFQMMGMFAEYERDTIRQNVKMGQVARSKSGMWVGGPAMLGYDWEVLPEYKNSTGRRKSKLVVNPQEAEVVKEIFNLYAEGYGYKAIANRMNKAGKITKRGNPFSISGIKDILLNPVYIGKVRYDVRQDWEEKRRKNINPNPIIVDGIHERIISDELWDKVQAIYNSRKGKRSRVYSYEYPLTGLMVCPKCGSGMVVAGTTNTLKDGTKKRIPYYSCGAFCNKGSAVCSSNSINALLANKETFERVERFCRTPALQERVIGRLKETNEKKRKDIDRQIEVYNNRISSIKSRVAKIFEAYEKDIISAEEFLSRKKALSKEEEEAKAEKDKLLEEKALLKCVEIPEQLIIDTLNNFADVLDRCNKKETKKALLQLLIKKITITNERHRHIKDVYLTIDENLINSLKGDEAVKVSSPFNLGYDRVDIII